MSIFQKSVEKKYLNELDSALIDEKFAAFQAYFGNPQIQENIRNSKEEQFQEGFLRELFVKILGYTLNPEPDFNLTTELKNIINAKKADGAILKNENAVAVIELKGTDTTDLDKVEAQAFGYKNHHPQCVYVITSNFEKLRFYIQNAVNHLDFDLFNLTKADFSLLWLCLEKTNLLSDLPLKIKEASVLQEENITKKLYADYSKFREDIYANLVQNNPETDKLILFKKTQKLLDRFLFVFFAEDRLLLPPNSISEIVKQWETLQDLDNYVPLYERFKKYFGYMDTGYKGKKYEIFAYNGGLFAPDEILDNIQIDDELLHDHTLRLSSYDFETDVDVNILGHIFEHSLNEIENVQAEIRGEVVDAQKTKRKKDGIFYTPKYITKYIVENTVGKLCEEKKTELGIDDEEYAKGRKSRKKEIIKELDHKLDTYRDWLLDLTIIDPACGSGSFLNQILEFLIEEHQKVDELRAQLLGGGFIFSDISTDILERNIYGVDLNEESVEIAKLSLWLRTAQKGRKLNSLNNNIKCGNSLIDDPEIAGEKAFNWEKEFPEVFAKGGFDVVVGNPPYVRQELFKEIKPYLQENYKCYNSVADLYTYFIEKGINLIHSKGKFSFILPNKFLKATYGKEIRKVLITETNLELIYDFDDYPVFEDATTYPIIFVLNKDKNYNEEYFKYSEINKRDATLDPINLLIEKEFMVSYFSLAGEMWNFIDGKAQILLDKVKNNTVSLNDFVNKKIFYGIKTGKNEAFVIDETTKDELISKDFKNAERIKILATGKEVKRNTFNFQKKYLLFTGFDDDIPKYYPDIQEVLDNYKEDLIKRYDQGENYWNLRACAYYDEMQLPKIIYPRINNRGNFYFDEKGEVFLLDNNFFISTDSKALLALLNSNLVFYYLKNICTTLQGGFYDFRRDKISTIPVSNNFAQFESSLEELSEKQIQNHNQFNTTISKFHRTLEREFSLENLSKKLESWYELSYADFLKELKKQKVELSLGQKSEWEDYFQAEQQKALALQTQINATDREIDGMVYELYGLTEEEIGVVEGASTSSVGK